MQAKYTIHGSYGFETWLICFGVNGGKYAIVPWILWDVSSLKRDEWIPKIIIPCHTHMTTVFLKVNPAKKNFSKQTKGHSGSKHLKKIHLGASIRPISMVSLQRSLVPYTPEMAEHYWKKSMIISETGTSTQTNGWIPKMMGIGRGGSGFKYGHFWYLYVRFLGCIRTPLFRVDLLGYQISKYIPNISCFESYDTH